MDWVVATKLNSTSVTSGTDDVPPFQGLRMKFTVPGALPQAGLFGPFGANTRRID